jgi:hypothetical protein
MEMNGCGDGVKFCLDGKFEDQGILLRIYLSRLRVTRSCLSS